VFANKVTISTYKVMVILFTTTHLDSLKHVYCSSLVSLMYLRLSHAVRTILVSEKYINKLHITNSKTVLSVNMKQKHFASRKKYLVGRFHGKRFLSPWESWESLWLSALASDVSNYDSECNTAEPREWHPITCSPWEKKNKFCWVQQCSLTRYITFKF